MRQIGRFEFPDTPEEAKGWSPYQTYYALASTALAVATTRVEGAWKAYCMGVPGYSHDREWHAVLAEGDELAEEVARAIFSEFKGVPYG